MVIAALPDPLVPPDCDCTDLDGFMLNVERLMASELVALGTHEEVAAAMFLWCRAWKQVPAASLPDDERVIAAFARMPLARFRKVRETVLRGFVKCSDGRLYHRFLSKEAARAFERKATFQRKRETEAERLRRWRATRSETADETHDETRFTTGTEARFVPEGQGQGQGQEERKETSLRSVGAPASPRIEENRSAKSKSKVGTRIPADWSMNETDAGFAKELGFSPQAAAAEAAKFRDFWIAKAGRDGIKLDWSATWRNWLRKAAERGIPPIAEVVQLPQRDDPRRWEARLSWARRHQKWAIAWGPMPGLPGCQVPVAMITSGDGEDWAEVEDGEARKEG